MSINENAAEVESGLDANHNRTKDANGETNEITANAVSSSSSGVDTICGDLGTAAVAEIRQILGQDVVLLPIPSQRKGPVIGGWQNTTLERMGEPSYLAQLGEGNIGVLLGSASGGLCAIDIDDDAAVAPFIALNPALAGTLRTKGKRGAQIWFRVLGDYPKLTKIKTVNSSDWGEWRADGGQSVIHGIHPDGMPYRRLVDAKPVEIAFADINWPADLVLPWVSTDFDELVEGEGDPFMISERGSVVLNQMFLVKKFIMEHRVMFDSGLGEFFEYDPTDGLWKRKTVDSIKRSFCDEIGVAAKIVGNKAISAKRTDSLLNGLVALLRCQVEKRDAFANRPRAIHVANGMIVEENGEIKLKSFSPDYLSRNQCPYEIDMEAECPRFKNELLGTALDEDDIYLFQRWAGTVLLGRNPAQRFLLLMGTPNGGKSTLMTILERIIGLENIAQLRTEHLADRFELFGYAGKTLLTGKDVSASFLMLKGAHTLKALVGGDMMDAEKKGVNERVQLRGDFNVGITCNADLNIRLEGDEGAWRRRLLVIKYERPAPAKRIADFAEKLLEEEGQGILRWMMEGAMAILAEIEVRGDYILSPVQKGRIDNLMSQSESVRRFVEDGVVRDDDANITVTELLSGYHEFCDARRWTPLPDREVRLELPRKMAEIHQTHQRHDIKQGITQVRGYKKVALVKGVQDEN